MPCSGWGSDPNGPIFYKGRYHLFYQARPGTCQWYWGMCWDHVVSTDLAHWERLPMALVPTPGGIDADGCFSGSIQVPIQGAWRGDAIWVEPQSGIPVCFYTAARLRTNRDVTLPHPPPAHDMGLKHIESQCCAICDPDDELLVRWRKVPMPLMELPHTGQLTAWRDPWFVEQGDGRGREWTMLIGSGLKEAGGTALVYRSPDITRGWRFAGHLCSWPNPGTGICWECPFLVQLQPLPLCAHVLPTTDLAAVAAAPTAAAASALNAAQEHLAAVLESPEAAMAAAERAATAPSPAGSTAWGQTYTAAAETSAPGVWTATATDATPAAAAKAAAAAVATEAASASPDAALSAAAAAAAAAVATAEAADADGTDTAYSVVPDSTTASCTTISPAGSARTGLVLTEDPDASSIPSGPVEDAPNGGGGAAAATSAAAAASAASPDGDAVLGPPAHSERRAHVHHTHGGGGGGCGGDALAVGLVDTLLHVVSSVSANGSGGSGGSGGAGGEAASTAHGAAAGDGDGGGGGGDAAAKALVGAMGPPEGGIGISVTAAAAPLTAQGGAEASTVTITVTRATPATADTAAGGGGPAAAAAAALAGEHLPAAMGSITTATATVRAGGDDGTPAVATIQVKVTPFAAAASASVAAELAAAAPPSLAGRSFSADNLGAISAAASLGASSELPLALGGADGGTVMEAHRTRQTTSAAALAAAAALHPVDSWPQRAKHDAGGAAAGAPAFGDPHCRLSYSPGVVGHSALPDPDKEVEPLPAPVTMRYCKAQPLLPPGASYSAAVGAASCLPLHGDVDSASGHAAAATLPEGRRWFFCCAPDACTYSIIYWISEYDSRSAKYDMEGAEAGGRPRKLDMGNVLYAPTCFKDPQGRHILWGYMKELRSIPAPPCLCNKYSYAGCISLPRALYLRGDKVFQLPLPELTALRSDVAVHVSRVGLTHGSPWRLRGVRGLHLDVELAISPGTARRTALLLRSWRPRGRGSAALVYDWPSRLLYIVYEALHPSRTGRWRGDEPTPAFLKQQGLSPPAAPATAAAAATAEKAEAGADRAQAGEPGAGLEEQPSLSAMADGGVGIAPPLPAAIAAGAAATTTPAAAAVPEPGLTRGSGESDFSFPTAEGGRGSGPRVETCELPAECVAECSERAWPDAETGAGSEEGLLEGSGGSEEEDDEENNDFDVVRDPDFIPDPDMNPLVEDWIRMKREEAGGELDLPPGAPLRLRIFLDASCLEVFTGTGQVLTTRVYRGHPPDCRHDGDEADDGHPGGAASPGEQGGGGQQPGPGSGPGSGGPDPGIELFSVGGDCVLDDLHAYEVHSAWPREEDLPCEVPRGEA
ncbi:hypothetical protein GPECTOR_30g206 [Gonium pectorale]|uniref:Glycosyl hydrolase family 32 N-terminal domain-containing protein n=1 Tax=Gonium pectorale TaxID=33097 RepID=A0A150GE29_GONPE|nr:hypothetical protein GPECTOR_30g206 [Gonium pectorale]|eukprot:KXZ48111.1 hypothetical protein GPECTOR_30g206 [Gonium pectorale]